MPRHAQVGASGTVLAATCSLALGISGALQHLQGVAGCEHVVVRGPVLATIHPDASAPLSTTASGPEVAVEERPYRRRPKLVKGAPAGGSAAERLKAATGEAGTAAPGRLLVDPDPEDAAREILAYLRQVGVLAPPASGL